MKLPFSVPVRFRSALPAFLGLLLLRASGPAVQAAPASAEQAAAAVAGWLDLSATPFGEALGRSVRQVDTASDKAGNPLYHIVSLAPAGFVLVAADDLVEPIIGFAAAGKFVPSEDNPLGALASRDLAGRMARARKAGPAVPGSAAAQAQAKWQQLCARADDAAATPKGLIVVSDLRVAPLLQSTWDQETAAGVGLAACYNYYTPPYGPGRTTNYPSGCVATAMAQFLRYYQYPDTGVGTASFTISVRGVPQAYSLRGGNGSGGPYLWSDMPLAPPATPTTAQCQAIGALVADAGATVNTDYAANGSAASVLDVKGALLGTFKFSHAAQGWKNNKNIGESLTRMINPNLDARGPVLLGIDGPNGGHAVVVDGYGYHLATLYHHLNLGWSGGANAWYALPFIDAAVYTFTTITKCIYNAYTNGTGEIISGRVLDQRARPVANATVSAVRTGGGTYTATTDTNGIYALARIPASSTYTLTVSKADFSSAVSNFTTGVSVNLTATCGNYWGANFTLNQLPTVLDRLEWSAIGATQSVGAPLSATLTALNADNGIVTGFAGPVALSACSPGALATNTLLGNLGSPQSQTDPNYAWTQGYEFTPATNLLAFAVRSYSGTKITLWTGAGTFIASRSVTNPPGTWTETALDAPVLLSAGTPYRLAALFPAGVPRYYTVYTGTWPTTFAHGTIGQDCYYIYEEGFPNQVLGSGYGLFLDLRYTVPYTNDIAITPPVSGSFVNGVWNGNITVETAAAGVVLKADDGAGHIGLSSPFNVIAPIQLRFPRITAGGQFQCTVSSAPSLKLEILGSTNLLNWAPVATLTNTSGAFPFTDPAALRAARFYRARQLN
ncbi:MAG TPA: C10 family peptidase [Verrucomicrobiota bacterium]|nr:C10 family peptidase [Verrucomicrobiota bacterium]HPI64654.1 C10 family peptidase [Verrucomicrobiota bacterium]